jgi:hypothetical protein
MTEQTLQQLARDEALIEQMARAIWLADDMKAAGSWDDLRKDNDDSPHGGQEPYFDLAKAALSIRQPRRDTADKMKHAVNYALTYPINAYTFRALQEAYALYDATQDAPKKSENPDFAATPPDKTIKLLEEKIIRLECRNKSLRKANARLRGQNHAYKTQLRNMMPWRRRKKAAPPAPGDNHVA